MLTTEKYTILEKPEDNIDFDTKLCILNFNIEKHKEYVKKLVDKYKNTTFWITSKNYSKEYIKFVSKLGIQNVIQFPINTSVIEAFFNSNNLERFNAEYLPLKTSKILIADDNQMNIELLKETLAGLNINIFACVNPIMASQLIQTEKFDLLLLDILMPEISGFELAETARKSDLNSNTQIIFISAITETKNKLNGYELGACSYIEKPFSPGIVKAQIYNFLKSIEEQKEQVKNQEKFIATLTHDLKSPINAEILALKYLLKSQNSNINDEMLTGILNSAKYMKQITDKILSFYKQQHGTLTLKKEYINPYQLILSEIEELKYLAYDKNIEIKLYNETHDELIYVDIIEIKRVIANLITNAIEYSFNNGTIDIRIYYTESDFIFEIQDYGQGINLKKYNKIFDEYITLSKEQKKIGFGLGLCICKNIIELHNGEINIFSSINKGTLIKFNIPLNILD